MRGIRDADWGVSIIHRIFNMRRYFGNKKRRVSTDFNRPTKADRMRSLQAQSDQKRARCQKVLKSLSDDDLRLFLPAILGEAPIDVALLRDRIGREIRLMSSYQLVAIDPQSNVWISELVRAMYPSPSKNREHGGRSAAGTESDWWRE